jgi:hypothetical protein
MPGGDTCYASYTCHAQSNTRPALAFMSSSGELESMSRKACSAMASRMLRAVPGGEGGGGERIKDALSGMD